MNDKDRITELEEKLKESDARNERLADDNRQLHCLDLANTGAIERLKAKVKSHEANIQMRAEHVEDLQEKLEAQEWEYEELPAKGQHIMLYNPTVDLVTDTYGELFEFGPARLCWKSITPPVQPCTHEANIQIRADTVERLQAQLKAHEWVSVKDRLPEDNMYKNILIMDGGCLMQGTYCLERGFEWWSGGHCNLDEKISQASVTHWKPVTLPDQPESEKPDEFIQPTMECPKCNVVYDDFDGQGVLHCKKCGYCTHDSVTDGLCDYCDVILDEHLKPESEVK